VTEALDALIAYRAACAEEAIRDARVLAEAGGFRACVNRLYYACFYAVSAVLIRKGLSSPRHTGVRSLFNQHFVMPGVISKDVAAIFNDLFERRHQGDYADFSAFTKEHVIPWTGQASVLVRTVLARATIIDI